eukprot:3613919-Lingulodinium_polyedra.AAC.1
MQPGISWQSGCSSGERERRSIRAATLRWSAAMESKDWPVLRPAFANWVRRWACRWRSSR